MNFLNRISPYIDTISDIRRDLILIGLVVYAYGDYSLRNDRKKLEKEADKAGYDDVYSYIRFHAYRYQECVAENGAEDSMCEAYKEYWLESKEAQCGRKINGKKVHKLLKEDATMAGYKYGYNQKKDRMFLKAIDSYVKCVAMFGDEFSKCKKYKRYWLERKAAQNGI